MIDGFVVRRRRQSKKRTRESSGFRKNLAAAQVRMIGEVPALRKGRVLKRPGRDSLVNRNGKRENALEEGTTEGLKRKNGIRDRA